MLTEVTCSEVDVLWGLSRLSTNKASGPDGISATMLKRCAESISPHLAAIYNLSFSTGQVPSCWKQSRVTRILKTGDPACVSNYRPISLLSLVGKSQERIVFDALLSHVLEVGALSDSQFGFRPGSSTQEALLTLTRQWHLTLDEGGSELCVFLDLVKAFDSIPHHLIITALHELGVRDPLLSWFRSYLTGRSQFVVIEGVSSAAIPVTSGVPQGSILGPLLFLIAFNPIFDVPQSPGSSLLGYADDLTYHKAIYGQADVPPGSARLVSSYSPRRQS